MKAKTVLLPAIRQYCHNTGKGRLAGYDKDETEKIVEGLIIDRKNFRTVRHAIYTLIVLIFILAIKIEINADYLEKRINTLEMTSR